MIRQCLLRVDLVESGATTAANTGVADPLAAGIPVLPVFLAGFRAECPLAGSGYRALSSPCFVEHCQ